MTDTTTTTKNQQLILTSSKRGLYECDYCRRDISQAPRIRCADCPVEFDSCLDCFTAHSRANVVDASTTNNNNSTSPNPAQNNEVTTIITTRKKGKKDKEAAAAAAAQNNTSKGDLNKNNNAQDNAKAAGTAAVSQHNVATHWYHVCDSTRYMLFPSTKPNSRESRLSLDKESNKSSHSSSRSSSKKSDHHKASKKSAHDNNKDASAKNTSKESSRSTTPTATTSNAPINISINEDPKNTWTIEEDLRLLDAIEQHGLGNWVDISEAVTSGIMGGSNKTAKRCMERYWDDYLGRYGHILPPVIKVNGTSLVETERMISSASSATTMAMTTVEEEKSSCEENKETNDEAESDKDKRYTAGYFLPQEMSDRVNQKVGRAERYKAETDGVKALAAATSKAECDKIRARCADLGVELPPRAQDVREMPGAEFAGYMPRRGDFDVEWENNAEAIMADMEFSRNDPDSERELKLQIMQIYNEQLEGRYKRKKFVQDHNLLSNNYKQQQLEDKKRPRDERDLVQRMRLFARFQTADEHRELVNAVLETKRMRKEIAQLQMYRRMGIKTMAEAEKYELDKSRREFHRLESAKDKKSVNATVSTLASLWPQYSSNKADRKSRKSINRSCADVAASAGNKDASATSTSGSDGVSTKDAMTSADGTGDDVTMMDVTKTTSTASASKVDEEAFDIMSAPGVGLLSSKEISLCKKLRLLPEFYLHAKRTLIQESLKVGFIDEKGHSNSVVKLDVEKKGEVIEFMLTSGWIKTKN